SIFDENTPHRLGSGGEEMAAAVPVRLSGPLLTLRALNKSDVCLVNQGRRLKRLTWFLLCQFLRRQPAQLVVHQRQQLLRGVRIALLDGGQDAGDVGHRQSSLQSWQMQWPEYNCTWNRSLAAGTRGPVAPIEDPARFRQLTLNR